MRRGRRTEPLHKVTTTHPIQSDATAGPLQTRFRDDALRRCAARRPAERNDHEQYGDYHGDDDAPELRREKYS